MFLWRNLQPDAVLVLLQLLAGSNGRGNDPGRVPPAGTRPAGDPTGEAPSERKA